MASANDLSTFSSSDASDCIDLVGILINEGAAPNAGDLGWQKCSTTTAALSYTLPATTEAPIISISGPKDGSDNISTPKTIPVIYDITVLTCSLNSLQEPFPHPFS